MITRSRYFFICSYILFMGLAIRQSGMDAMCLIPAVIGICWILGSYKQWLLISNLGFISIYSYAAFALMNQAHPFWSIVACVAGTAAWDLDHFFRYLSTVNQIKSEHMIVRRHFFRLSILMGLSVVIAYVALQVDLKLSLFPVIVLVAILLFTLKKEA